MDRLHLPATQRPYRALHYGERPLRRTCPCCRDRHVALVDRHTGTIQCRACGWMLGIAGRMSGLDGTGRPVAPDPRTVLRHLNRSVDLTGPARSRQGGCSASDVPPVA